MESEHRHIKLQGQIQSLRSSNKNAILGTLNELRFEGNVAILTELFQVMLVQEDEQILGEITQLLNDLKDKEAAEVLARAIANPEYEKIQHTLVAACWQNGLSYGKFIDIFAEVLISAEYEAALEAFTVLEEAIGEVDPQAIKRLSSKLEAKLNEVDDLKKPLVAALVKTINNYENQGMI
jgi:hypothetical protein